MQSNFQGKQKGIVARDNYHSLGAGGGDHSCCFYLPRVLKKLGTGGGGRFIFRLLF